MNGQQHTISPFPDGLFAGNFQLLNQGAQKRLVTITLLNNFFKATCSADFVPAGGSGHFSFINDEKIIFYNHTIWPPDIDKTFILDGEYTYHVTDNSLMLMKLNGDKPFYEYQLHKID